jgi:hypothetical protein
MICWIICLYCRTVSLAAYANAALAAATENGNSLLLATLCSMLALLLSAAAGSGTAQRNRNSVKSYRPRSCRQRMHLCVCCC